MPAVALWMNFAVVVLAMASLLALVIRSRKTVAEVAFAVFCGSMAMNLLRNGLDGQADWLMFGLALAGCATCNAYWLVARALFRGDAGVRLPQVSLAAGVALLIVTYRALQLQDPAWGVVAAIGELLTLAGSAMLVLTFVEALRGWSASMTRAERRLRIGFMLLFGSCVVLATTVGALAAQDPTWHDTYRVVVASCALSVLVFTYGAMEFRRRQARADGPGGTTMPVDANGGDTAAAVSPADRQLADAVLHALAVDALFRQPELKLGTLARHVGSSEQRVRHVIRSVVGARNYNELVNRYRIADACRLLDEPAAHAVLAISLECGFASLGPFNRAFKAVQGCTPTEYRAARRGSTARADARPIDCGEATLADG